MSMPLSKSLTALEVRRRIESLRQVVREVRDVYPRMELGQLDLLLTVTLHPGVRGADLLESEDGTGLTKGGLYKALKVLSDENAPGSVEGRVSGLSLITKVPDPSDMRASLLVPSRRGHELMRSLADKMAS